MNDIEPGVELRSLDPGQDDPGYWHRFHSEVMAAAEMELARRRVASLSVSGVLLSWSRAVVPAAAVAALVAGVLLLPPAPVPEAAASLGLGVEEILREEAVRAELAPVFLSAGEFPEDVFLVAVEGFASRGDR